MKEKWPIDGEQLFEFLSDQLVKESGAFSKGVNKGLNIARSAIHNIDAVKPIDTETLPLVKELLKKIEELEDQNRRLAFQNLTSESSLENITLRAALQAAEKEIRKVIAERDAAVDRIEKAQIKEQALSDSGEYFKERFFRAANLLSDSIVLMEKIVLENNSAIEQLRGVCSACKHYTPYHNDGVCATCTHERACYKPWEATDKWEWKGLTEDENEEEN